MKDEGLRVFDALYEAAPDPWGTHSLWYEKRKRSILLSTLPQEQYASAYEAGCGTGHLTLELAKRCGKLLAGDGSHVAITIASSWVAGCENVRLEQQTLPAQWPAAVFDLIVLSEVLYFVDRHQMSEIARLARASAGTSGLVVACNWRGFIDGWGHTGESVHRSFAKELDLPVRFEYSDEHFILNGWCAGT